MDRKQKENLMNDLLLFMNEEVEGSGNTINVVRFDFNDQGEDAINFANKTGLRYDQLLPVLNTCFSRKYITQKLIGAGKYGMAQLTEEGQGRAISVEAAKHARSGLKLRATSLLVNCMHMGQHSLATTIPRILKIYSRQ
jgi:hypothetical protein